jgi:hypothetical protein
MHRLLCPPFSTALTRYLNNTNRRADAPRLLHDSVPLRAQAAALATLEVTALDFVSNHLVEQLGVRSATGERVRWWWWWLPFDLCELIEGLLREEVARGI